MNHQHKSLRNNLLPIKLKIPFQLHESNENTNLRKGKNIKVIWRNTKIFHKSVFHKGIKLWNLLDEKLQKCNSIWSFKNNLKKFYENLDESMAD